METSILGERFGKLVVIGPSAEIRYGCHTVLCRCDCGRETVVDYKHLADGERVSCGCLRSGPRSARMKSLASLAPSV